MVASLRGGNNRPSSSQPKAFKEEMRAGFFDAQNSIQNLHLVYIVDKSEEVPTLEIKQLEVIQNLLLHKE